MKCDERATVYHKLALEMIQRLFPDDHRYLANIYDKLGIAFSWMRDNNRAIEYHKQALEIRKRQIPVDHQSVALTYERLRRAELGLILWSIWWVVSMFWAHQKFASLFLCAYLLSFCF